MYIGNGVTKKFPLPAGYDGNVVILKIPNGKGVRMIQGEGYVVKDGVINFYAPVPDGIEILFDNTGEIELMSTKSKSYVVIYSDGSIREVDEDPTLMLEEARKILTDAKKAAIELNQNIEDAKTYMSRVLSNSGADLDGRLDGYSSKVAESVAEAALQVKTQITNEWSATLERLEVEKATVKKYSQTVEQVKDKLEHLSFNIAQNLRDELLSKCNDVLQNCEDLKILKTEIQSIAAKVKLEVAQISRNAVEEMRLKINEELELLRNLRAKMESDYNNLNTRINNRWNLMRGESDG